MRRWLGLVLVAGCMNVDAASEQVEPNIDQAYDFNLEHGVCDVNADTTLRAVERHGGDRPQAYMLGLILVCDTWAKLRSYMAPAPAPAPLPAVPPP